MINLLPVVAAEILEHRDRRVLRGRYCFTSIIMYGCLLSYFHAHPAFIHMIYTYIYACMCDANSFIFCDSDFHIYIFMTATIHKYICNFED